MPRFAAAHLSEKYNIIFINYLQNFIFVTLFEDVTKLRQEIIQKNILLFVLMFSIFFG